MWHFGCAHGTSDREGKYAFEVKLKSFSPHDANITYRTNQFTCQVWESEYKNAQSMIVLRGEVGNAYQLLKLQ